MEAVNMTWCNNTSSSSTALIASKSQFGLIRSCPNCGHKFQLQELDGGGGGGSRSSIQDLPGLPAGVKFDPSDQELLEHLEGKARPELKKHQPLIDEFIPTLEGENGICYTHPEKLPGVSRDGLIRHFFHRPSKAYTTGTRKRRKVDTDVEGGETRWHKTGKTRPVLANGKEIKGYKKILVLYRIYGKQQKPEKTNWVMHQYHLGSDEQEKDGELVVSKVFYQTQPRQSGSGSKEADLDQMKSDVGHNLILEDDDNVVDYYNPSLMASLMHVNEEIRAAAAMENPN